MWWKALFLFLAFSLTAGPAEGGEFHLVCPLNCEHQRPLYVASAGLLEGDDVRELQEQLQAAGLFRGPVSGAYGPVTAEAVRSLQEANGIEPSGVVNAETWYLIALMSTPVKTGEPLPPPTGEVEIIIDVQKRTLTVIENGHPYRQFPCAVGKSETPTPVGNWSIRRKAKNWGTGFGTRWLGLNVDWGIYGIHGTNKPHSIGTRASHGCIRMFNRHIEELFPWVEEGTPVHIVGNIMGPTHRPTLVHGDRESGVLEMQRLMQKHGYYDGPIDGIFGSGLQKAVVQFRKDHNLRHDNRVDREMYDLLGL